jgi:hypothetical protein
LEIKYHYWNLHKGHWPTTKKPDLIFFDLPYYTKKEKEYREKAKDKISSISSFSKGEYKKLPLKNPWFKNKMCKNFVDYLYLLMVIYYLEFRFAYIAEGFTMIVDTAPPEIVCSDNMIVTTSGTSKTVYYPAIIVSDDTDSNPPG